MRKQDMLVDGAAAGIHFPMDNVAGLQLGTSVSQLFIAWAQSDGSQ